MTLTKQWCPVCGRTLFPTYLCTWWMRLLKKPARIRYDCYLCDYTRSELYINTEVA